MTARRSGTLFWLPVILDDASLDPTETLLLVALADHVDLEDSCFVGIDRLAGRARVSYATARRRLTALEARGVITRDRRRRDDGNLSVYGYVLQRSAFGVDEPPLNLSDDHGASGRAVTSAHEGERAEPPRGEPPRTEPLVLVPPVVVSFDDFWRVFPRKSGKPAAKRAWDRAVKRADPTAIVAGAEQYRDDPNREDRFTKWPQGWLNDDRWNDPPLPSRTGRPSTTGPRAVVDPSEEALRRAEPGGRITDL